MIEAALSKSYEAGVSEVSKEGLKKSSENLPSFAKNGYTGKIKTFDDADKKIQKFESKMLPDNNGVWSGEKGSSVWKPDREIVPKRPYGNEYKFGSILDKYGIEGIKYKQGEPDFTPVSQGTVKIDNFSIDRNANFTQADTKCAKIWTEKGKSDKEWFPMDVRKYRQENNLSWHERSDMKTLDLVPQEIHGNFPHSGGISALKFKQKII